MVNRLTRRKNVVDPLVDAILFIAKVSPQTDGEITDKNRASVTNNR